MNATELPPPSEPSPLSTMKPPLLAFLFLLPILKIHADDETRHSSPASHLSWLDPYNISWHEPGTKALHSMPCGGGNVALNLWTTPEDLRFYIASPDSWNGQSQVKMGRVRISLTPNPFAGKLHQELKLADNSIHISGQAADGTELRLQVWVDAFQPVVHVNGTSSKPVKVKAAIELLGGAQGGFDRNAALWHFRIDGPSPQRRDLIAKNHIEKIAKAVPDPMANHTWGGRLTGTGFVAAGSSEAENEGVRTTGWNIATPQAVESFDIQATLRIAQDPSLGTWKREVAALESHAKRHIDADQARTRKWWSDFWSRSHIVIQPGKSAADPAWEVGRNYQLFRAMLATNRSGKMPTLFNGGPFLMETDPNERQWAHAGFTAQNQRLLHWPMLKSGDADLLKVGLDFYKSRHGLAIAWAKHFWNIRGAVFPEDIDLFGLPVYTTKDGSGHTAPECLRYHYVSGMEFALMMLQSSSYFGTDPRPYLPIADGMLRFFDQFYRKQHLTKVGRELDEDGRLVIFPGNALESHAGTTNDAPTLAGLHALSGALLDLPDHLASPSQRSFWKSFAATLPALPVHKWKGVRQIAPAKSWQSQRPDFNMELPHLYPVFPFHLYGVGLPDLALARDSFEHGDTCPAKQKNHFCWYQGGLFATRLGLTHTARNYALAKFLHPRHPDPVEGKGWSTQKSLSPWELRWAREGWEIPRYPAFWDGLTFCGRPDMDHGGAAMAQLQEMLLQTPGDKLHLFPAWPADWDVDFKLHAPRETIVEGSLRDGRLQSLKVTPASRSADLVNWLGKVPPYLPPTFASARMPILASSTWPGTGFEASMANDSDLMTRWGAAKNAREASLTIEFDKPTELSRAWISEKDFAHTRQFAIEALLDDAWREIARGTTIGADKSLAFPALKTRTVRLKILKADGPININEFQVFATPNTDS
ncbi:MAG: discoidin domain-containing protein [Verrucomicrobia bacterium]|nr:MAG: discoidin domain-containing protein [Verrucomicrobiota bacterium]TAE89339.1 MAG: discoidin domain-containing protein [Verrucomicrobiota bacterium]TAF27785.1 MAG: discoidin domain-containing protein [Verrucomicrobiota bacterium]TAF42634.1 MAG: discoidin domain-containing protein [Verrucomicrobiota bacterium]